jgi:hypothetical protein
MAMTMGIIVTSNMITMSLTTLKQRVTKVEMSGIVQVIAQYEEENDALPATLNDLGPYLEGNGYKKDAWRTAYTYDDTARELCSVNDAWGTAPNDKYCKEF